MINLRIYYLTFLLNSPFWQKGGGSKIALPPSLLKHGAKVYANKNS